MAKAMAGNILSFRQAAGGEGFSYEERRRLMLSFSSWGQGTHLSSAFFHETGFPTFSITYGNRVDGISKIDLRKEPDSRQGVRYRIIVEDCGGSCVDDKTNVFESAIKLLSLWASCQEARKSRPLKKSLPFVCKS
ncbi:MAG: hypothetical protein H6868_00525 [Rhodospirillales bacterium]|nr:hypothetical protein [Rhodospirillales bacterium]